MNFADGTPLPAGSTRLQGDAISSSRSTVMSDLARVEIDRDVADAAARRAEEQGLTVTAYISLLVRRSVGRAPGEVSVIVYDHVEDSGEFHIHRETDEDEERYRPRLALYDSL